MIRVELNSDNAAASCALIHNIKPFKEANNTEARNTIEKPNNQG